MQYNKYKPLVSIIMPLYKQERFIPRAIASLLAQTLIDWELIIINDGSPGKIPDTIQSSFLQDPRISLYKHSLNKGLGAALNAGINKARASYITYLPCDDVIHKDHIKTLYSSLI